MKKMVSVLLIASLLSGCSYFEILLSDFGIQVALEGVFSVMDNPRPDKYEQAKLETEIGNSEAKMSPGP
jgi:hypothetical protein